MTVFLFQGEMCEGGDYGVLEAQWAEVQTTKL